MFPKTGKDLSRCELSKGGDYPSTIAEILRAELGPTHQALKTLMRWTGANERTAKNWLSGANGPSGEHLLKLIRNSDRVFECVLALSDRKAVLSYSNLEEILGALQATAETLSNVIKAEQSSRPDPGSRVCAGNSSADHGEGAARRPRPSRPHSGAFARTPSGTTGRKPGPA